VKPAEEALWPKSAGGVVVVIGSLVVHLSVGPRWARPTKPRQAAAKNSPLTSLVCMSQDLFKPETGRRRVHANLSQIAANNILVLSVLSEIVVTQKQI